MIANENIRVVLGKNIRRRRMELNMTQDALAEKSGFSTRYISDIENGFANLTVDKIQAIATVLKISYVSLFTEEKK